MRQKFVKSTKKAGEILEKFSVTEGYLEFIKFLL